MLNSKAVSGVLHTVVFVLLAVRHTQKQESPWSYCLKNRTRRYCVAFLKHLLVITLGLEAQAARLDLEFGLLIVGKAIVIPGNYHRQYDPADPLTRVEEI